MLCCSMAWVMYLSAADHGDSRTVTTFLPPATPLAAFSFPADDPRPIVDSISSLLPAIGFVCLFSADLEDDFCGSLNPSTVHEVVSSVHQP